MDRLTYRSPCFSNAVSYGVCADVECGGKCDECRIEKIISKLCEYEDTGLTPEEIIKLKSIENWAGAVEYELDKYIQAEKGGRLVTLPCMVTSTVYVVETMFKGKKEIGEQVVSAQIDHVTIGGATGKPVYDLCSETGNWYHAMEPEDFYLTKEEAQAAMKEG